MRDESDFLLNMKYLLKMLGQPVELRRLKAASVLLLGPYKLKQTQPWPGHFLSICHRQKMELELALPTSLKPMLDFQIRCPIQIDAAHRNDVAWLIGFINLWLPLGSFQLPHEGNALFLYELPFPQQELPVSVFVETTALLLDGFAQSAPLLQAVAEDRLRAEDVRAWLCGHRLEPAALKQVLRSQRHIA